MANPVWLDGPLSFAEHEVPDDVVNQGMYRYSERDVYTFTLVTVFERQIVVASTRNALVDSATLFHALLTPQARRAAWPS